MRKCRLKKRRAQGSSFASPSPGLLQDRNHVAIATASREFERRRPAAIGNIDVGAGLDQGAQGLGVVVAAIAEHDRFDQRGPLQIVDVIERRVSGDQCPHDFGVTEMRGRDQRRAVINAGDSLRVAAAFKRGFSIGTSLATAAMVMMS